MKIPDLGAAALRDRLLKCIEDLLEKEIEFPTPTMVMRFPSSIATSVNFNTTVKDHFQNAYWQIREKLLGLGLKFEDGTISVQRGPESPDNAVIICLLWRHKDAK